MTQEQKDFIARSAASTWSRCYKCDGVINGTQIECSKERLTTCLKWFDGYKTALIALDKIERLGENNTDAAQEEN